jgi:serine/threonine protein kinase
MDHGLPNTIEFNRPKKYAVIGRLGHGACGETVHVRDGDMGIDLVIKKYAPIEEIRNNKEEYMINLQRFREEAKLLFSLNHSNVVRVYSYFNYEANLTSFILMEHVNGEDILKYIGRNPIEAEYIFERLIEAFSHLEAIGVLHRDIRPQNILVSHNGEPKIIDFGFGKRVNSDLVQTKSISLNWWCEIPPEFSDGTYDFQTEVYFVGKLFEAAITNGGLTDFKYLSNVKTMCYKDRSARYKSFQKIQANIVSEKFDEIEFSEKEIEIYRDFSGGLYNIFATIEGSAKFNTDIASIMESLSELHKSTMLEDCLPNNSKLASVFVLGGYSYRTGQIFYVYHLREFLRMLTGFPGEKRGIVIANLVARLDGIERSAKPNVATDFDDEIPF